MNLLVTALVDLYPEETQSRLGVDFRISCLNRLLETGADIVAFVEASIIERVSKPKSALIIPIELQDIATYRRVLGAEPRLPVGRNSNKDTLKYLALMAAKFDFIQNAMSLKPKCSHYTWIDAGIPKFFGDELTGKVTALRRVSTDKITAALGTYPALTPASFETGHPYWRFLGGLFVFPRRLVGPFTKEFDRQLTELLSADAMTWEVNIVARIESIHPDWFCGYVADHNETMLNMPQKFLS